MPLEYPKLSSRITYEILMVKCNNQQTSPLWPSVQPGVQPHLSGVSIRDTGAICGL